MKLGYEWEHNWEPASNLPEGFNDPSLETDFYEDNDNYEPELDYNTED